MDKSALIKKAILLFAATPFILGLAFFLPAGTLDYWQAWVYISVILIPASFVVLYFIKNDPEFLERRLKMKEKEAKQKFIIKATALIFTISFLLPGFDKRFGWSNTPAELVIAANIIVLLSYLFIFLVFKENSYAGRTVEVVSGQKVISTGPYSIVRHPMYVGVILMYSATPIALGSYIALPFFLLLIPFIVLRILNEEEVLRRDLPGYSEYCQKTRYRLLPFVW
ncbi:MAG: isoprenylcysteine carboxylmethyltransferase family protein [Candidatus Micrarchaeota archaeon]